MQDLKAIQNKRIYFGHQSVGANVIQGYREIVASAGVGPELQESAIGTNGDPNSKCEDFARNIDRRAGSLDIALMKFCYIDFETGTDASALFAHYSKTVDALRVEHPKIVFIPVTAPLTVAVSAWKRTIKSAMGKADVGAELNAKRAQFNRLLLEHYKGQPVFDLAAVESQGGGSLRAEYSSDGGHLNATGRRVAAQELIRTLAKAASPGAHSDSL